MSGYLIVLILFPGWLAALYFTLATRQGRGPAREALDTDGLFNTLCIVGPLLCSYLAWARYLMPVFGAAGIGMSLFSSSHAIREAGLNLIIGTLLAISLLVLLLVWSHA